MCQWRLGMENNISKEPFTKRHPSFKKKNIITKLTLSLCVNLFTFFTLLFFPPLDVIAGNTNEFCFAFSDVFRLLLAVCLGAAVIVTAIETLLPTKVTVILDLICFSFGLCFYAQSMLLNGGMGTLTGGKEKYSVGLMVADIAAWVVIFAVVIVDYFLLVRKNKKYRKPLRNAIKFLSLLFVVMQTVGLVSETLKIDTSNKLHDMYLSDVGEYDLSDGKNTVIFIVDTLDSDLFETAYDAHPEMTDAFTGFTYYPNAVSTHSRTYPSVPYLLTGSMCHFDKPYSEFISESWDNAELITELGENGYDVGIYTSQSYVTDNAVGKVDNLVNAYDDSLQITGTLKQTVKMSLYRCAPYSAKNFFRYSVSDINNSVAHHNDSCIQQNDIAFYKRLKSDGLKLNKSENSYRFIHFFGTHPGAEIDENVNRSSSYDNVAVTRGCMKIIEDYISEMKRLGVYEDSTVIITADHGFSMVGGSNPLVISQPLRPTLIVKPAGVGENTPFTVSDAPVSHADIFATVADAAGLDTEHYGTPIYDVPSDSDRVRYYYNSALYSDDDGEVALREYEITGDARKFENWKLTGNYWDIDYSERAVSKHRLGK